MPLLAMAYTSGSMCYALILLICGVPTASFSIYWTITQHWPVDLALGSRYASSCVNSDDFGAHSGCNQEILDSGWMDEQLHLLGEADRLEIQSWSTNWASPLDEPIFSMTGGCIDVMVPLHGSCQRQSRGIWYCWKRGNKEVELCGRSESRSVGIAPRGENRLLYDHGECFFEVIAAGEKIIEGPPAAQVEQTTPQLHWGHFHCTVP